MQTHIELTMTDNNVIALPINAMKDAVIMEFDDKIIGKHSNIEMPYKKDRWDWQGDNNPCYFVKESVSEITRKLAHAFEINQQEMGG